jgi:hypothetical protein
MVEWRYSSIFLDLDTRWKWVVSFSPHGERAPCTHWVGGWLGPRVGLDAVEKGNISYTDVNGTRAVQPVARYYTDWAIATHGWYLFCMYSGGQCVRSTNLTCCRGRWPGMKSKFLTCDNPNATSRCDNVLPGQGYRTPQGAVIDAYGAMGEWWLVGANRRNCWLFNNAFRIGL